MYCYSGYQGYGNSCGCGYNPCCNPCGGYGSGCNNGAIILVLFILLVIIIGCRCFGN